MSAANVYVAASPIGRGVFAGRDFALGETVLRFSGRVLALDDVWARGVDSMNPLQIAPRVYVDLEPPGVFMNHSCAPNAGLRDDLFLVALRAISRGEEIRFDYSTTMLERLETMACRCGAPECRGMIGDFDLLSPARQRHYREADVVMSHVVGVSAAHTARDV